MPGSRGLGGQERQETEVQEGKGPTEAAGCWLFPVSPGTSVSAVMWLCPKARTPGRTPCSPGPWARPLTAGPGKGGSPYEGPCHYLHLTNEESRAWGGKVACLKSCSGGRAGLPSQDAPPNTLLGFFALNHHKREQAPWVPTPVSLPSTPGTERVLKEGGSKGRWLPGAHFQKDRSQRPRAA